LDGFFLVVDIDALARLGIVRDEQVLGCPVPVGLTIRSTYRKAHGKDR
jgi:hypothetical protein